MALSKREGDLRSRWTSVWQTGTLGVVNATQIAVLLLIASLVGFYVVAYAVSALGGRLRGGLWESLGYALPVLGVVGLGAAVGQTDVALGAAMSSGVAALGLVAGVTLLQSRRSAELATPVEAGTWALLIPAALATLLVALSGSAGPVRVGAMAVLAFFVLRSVPVLRKIPVAGLAEGGGAAEDEGAGVLDVAPVIDCARPAEPKVKAKRQSEPMSWAARLSVVAAALVAVCAGWAGVEGVVQLAKVRTHVSPGLLAVAMLGPAALLPLLGRCTSLAYDGEAFHGMSLAVRQALISCLVGVPLAAVVFLVRGWMVNREMVTLSIPASLARVECVLMLVLGSLLLPIGTGRVTPTKATGMLLLAVYVLYVGLSAISYSRTM